MTTSDLDPDALRSAKRNYVRSKKSGAPGKHHCHWPGCDKLVHPTLWGCYPHWMKLPMRLRNLIWATYKPGQEETKTPSASYLAVAREVQEWITAREPGVTGKGEGK